MIWSLNNYRQFNGCPMSLRSAPVIRNTYILPQQQCNCGRGNFWGGFALGGGIGFGLGMINNFLSRPRPSFYQPLYQPRMPQTQSSVYGMLNQNAEEQKAITNLTQQAQMKGYTLQQEPYQPGVYGLLDKHGNKVQTGNYNQLTLWMNNSNSSAASETTEGVSVDGNSYIFTNDALNKFEKDKEIDIKYNGESKIKGTVTEVSEEKNNKKTITINVKEDDKNVEYNYEFERQNDNNWKLNGKSQKTDNTAQ